MGLFDGVKSFVNDVQKNIDNNVVKPVTTTINDAGNTITDWARGNSDVPQLLQPNPIIKEATKIIDNPPDVPKIITEDIPTDVKEWAAGNSDLPTIFQPNPIIKSITNPDKVKDEVKQNWDNATETVTKTVNTTIINPVKETVSNIGKGLNDALPIVAIGGGAIVLASLLLGRR